MQANFINPYHNKDAEQRQEPQDFASKLVEDHNSRNPPQIQTSARSSSPEDRENAAVASRPLVPQIPSDDIGIEKDLSLNQALKDSKQYESFMHELKQVHRKECE